MRMFLHAVARGLLVAALALAPAAASAGTLDQHQDQTSNAYSEISGPNAQGTFTIAQTFTAGLTGVLDQVDLYLELFTGSVNPITVEIRDVGATGAPGSNVLATATFTPSTLGPDWFPVQYATPAAVAAGTSYAIVASTRGDSTWGWGLITSGNPYPAGAAFYSPSVPPSAWNERIDQDQAFRTYVAPPQADLALTMASASRASAHSALTYTLVVTNQGPNLATNVVLTDNLPFGVVYTAVTSSQGTCTPPGKKVHTVICQLGDLSSGGQASSAVTVKITAEPTPSFINNVASVSADTDDPDPANNTASFSTQVTR